MFEEFIDLINEIFPSVTDATKEAAKRVVHDWSKISDKHTLTIIPPTTYLLQGDIFSHVAFPRINNDGKIVCATRKGILLNNTCDCVHRENLQFACIRELKEYSNLPNEINSIKSNTLYSIMYLNEVSLSDCFIDFNTVATISRARFYEKIKQHSTHRLYSLSDIGYYMFLLKLTVYLMRREDNDANKKRTIQLASC